MSAASSHKIRTSSAAITYVPTPSKAEQIAEAIGCIITGRPLPAYLAPAPVAVRAVSSMDEGFARILRG